MNWRRAFLYLFVALVVFYFIAPMLIIIPMSLSSGSSLRFPPPGLSTKWFEEFFTNRQWTDAALVSIQLGVATAIVSTVLGTLTALGLVRGRYPFRGAINALVLSPLIVPVVVIAIGTFFAFDRIQDLLPIRLTGEMPGAIAAHSVLAIPFVVINVSVSLRTIDRTIEMAAQNLGAGPWQTFRRITLPIALPGVTAGALFAFITSWDETVVSYFVVNNPRGLRTLPVVMWNMVRLQVEPTIAAVAVLLMAVTTLGLLLIVLARRRVQA